MQNLVVDFFKTTNVIDIVYLDDKDVIRHKVVKKIIDAYKKTEHAN